jgi:hypothetical protein
MLADLVFAAARSAALYARRRQEAHYDCVEHKRREAERQQGRELVPNGREELR